MKSIIASVFMFCSCFAAAQDSDVHIGISATGGDAKIKIAMPAFDSERKNNKQDAEMATSLHQIIRADLLFSRYFDVLESESGFNPKDSKAFDEAFKSGARYVIYGKASLTDKTWTLSVSLYDTENRDSITQKYYKGELAGARKAAHLFADEAVLKITGKKGIAHTRIAFSNDSTSHKEIYSVDYDGMNLTRLTNDRSIALLPKWSPDGNHIYYMTYRYKNPDMFEIDLQDRKIKPVSISQGLNIPGGVSPDGDKIVMTMSRGKNPGIYVLDLQTKQFSELSPKTSVDSSGSYSPDGNFVAFISNRSGNPQVHITEIATGKTRKVTRLNWCDSPKWSPTGEWIVFSGRQSTKDKLDIFITDITGSQLRNLTKDSDSSNEDPTWSPDGRFIAFTSTRNGMRQIYVMDSDGSAPHLISKLPGKCYTPNWSQ